MISKYLSSPIFFLCLSAVVLAGCATTRVDVDVYKGPLANHEAVQAEQMAVMAVGAKPLLIQLREILERKGDPEFKTTDWDPAGLGTAISKKYDFIDTNARRVDDILSLYQDVPDKELAELITRAKKASKDYVRAYKILNPETPKPSEEFWKDLSLKSEDANNIIKKWKPSTNKTKPDAVTSEVKALISAYKTYFCPGKNKKRTVKSVIEASETLREKLKDISKFTDDLEFLLTPGGNCTQANSKKCTTPCPVYKKSSNGAFKILAESGLAKAHARLFFPDEKKRQKRFSDEAIKIARAYQSAESALEEVMVATIETLIQLSKNNLDPNPSRYGPTAGLINFLADLVQPYNLLAWELALPDSGSGHSPLLFDTDKKPDIIQNLPGMKELKYTFQKSLSNNPLKSAQTLLHSHRESKSPGTEYLAKICGLNAEKPNFRASLSTEIGWEYGITRGPNLDAEQFTHETDLAVQAGAAFSAIGGVFSEGRYYQGLNTLIQDYIDAVHSPGDSQEKKDKIKVARERLGTSLIHFAQKVLYLANNSVLLKEETATELPGRTNEFVAVLQAVGNAILIQADEKKFRDAHKKKLKEELDGEINALQHSFFYTPEREVALVIQSFRNTIADLDVEINALKEEINRQDTIYKTESGKYDSLKAEEEKPQAISDIEKILSTAEALDGKMTQVHQMTGEWKLDAKSIAEETKSKAGNTEDLEQLAKNAKVVISQAKILKKQTQDVLNDIDTVGNQSLKHNEEIVNLEPQTKTVLSGFLSPLIRLNAQDGQETIADLKEGQKKLDVAVSLAQCIQSLDKDTTPPTDNKLCTSDGKAKPYDTLRDELATLVNEINDAFKTGGSLAQKWSATSGPKGKISQAMASQTAHPDWATLLTKDSNRLKQLKGKIASAKTDRDKAQATLANTTKKRAPLETEHQALKIALETVLKHQGSGDANGVEHGLEGLIAVLAKKASEADTQERPKLQAAITQLRAHWPAIASLGKLDLSPKGEKDALKVLDQLVHALHYRYIDAVRQGGKGAKEAANAKDALEAVYAYRSGMIYIRPASSYLRSSYATTALQGDPGLKWENLLEQHGLRNTPFFGTLLYNYQKGMGRKNYEIISNIDKQFWQNINSVRVSGAGDTNYVIAKDDIGNWYVKNYSADPGPIIKGAQSLAGFALGAKLETDLLARIQAARLGKPGPAPGGAAMDSSLGKVLARYADEYNQKTREDLQLLLDELKGVSDEETNCPLVLRLRENLFARPEIEAGKAEVNKQIKTAAASTLVPAEEALEKAKGDDTEIASSAAKAQTATPEALSADIIPLLEGIRTNPADATGNAALLEQIESQPGVAENEALSKELAALKEVLGNPDPGSRILEALHEVRRFHNQLLVLLASTDFAAPNEERIKQLEAALTEPTEKPKPSEGEAKVEQEGDDNAEKEKAKNQANLDQARADVEKAGQTARNLTTRTLRTFLDGMIDRRQTALDAYESQILFLGDIARN